MDRNHPALWATLGVVISTVVSVVVWTLLIIALGWPLAVTLLAVPVLVWVLVELRRHRR